MVYLCCVFVDYLVTSRPLPLYVPAQQASGLPISVTTVASEPELKPVPVISPHHIATTDEPPSVAAHSIPVTIGKRLSVDDVKSAGFLTHKRTGNVLFIKSLDHTQTVSTNDLSMCNFNDLFRPKLDSAGINYAVAMEEIQSLIIERQPIAVVFILSPLMLNDVPFFSKYISNQLKYFYGLLKFMNSFQATKVLLLTTKDSFTSVIHFAWFKAFSYTLVSLTSGRHSNGGIITLNRIEEAAAASSDDRSKECTDIPYFLENVLGNMNNSFETEVNYCSSKYPAVTKGKSIIFSTYFTSGKYSQYGRPFKSNKFSFMKKWLLTGRKFDLTMGLFHDELNEDFISRLQTFYPNSKFIKVTKFGPNRTPNDGRFYIWYDYLVANPDIERILFTDLRDVQFFTNPFDVMEDIGDYLFLGIDNSFHMSTFSNNGIKSNTLKCHEKDKDDVSFFLNLGPFYNAGALGGERKTVLNFLKHMTDHLNQTPKNRNCNMGTYAFVSSKYFLNSSFTGYPFQSSFKMGVTGPTNVAVKHKTYPGNNVMDETLD